MTLNEFAPGAMLEITKLTGSGAVKRRIMDMGLTRGPGCISGKWHRWEIRWSSRSAAMN